MILEECTGYKDSKGEQYYIGDIVLNPYFGDLWIVFRSSHKELECPYILAQYGNEDNYYMELDEPVGFIILKHRLQEGYSDLLDECTKISKEINSL